MDRFTEMRTFVQVVDAGSFIGAAEPLGLSKAAVSRHVGELEARLGVRLLQRTTRKLSLTGEGEVFYLRCKELLGGVEAAEAEITSRSGEAIGLLRVNAPVSFGVLHLADAWPAFRARHLKVTFEVTLTDRVADIVEEGVDLAIRIATLQDSSLVSRRLSSTRMVLCASPKYLVVQTSPSLRTNNGDTCRAGALAHEGIILQPSFIVGPDLQSGALVELCPGYRSIELGIYAVYGSRKHVAPKVRLLIDFLARRLATKHWPD